MICGLVCGMSGTEDMVLETFWSKIGYIILIILVWKSENGNGIYEPGLKMGVNFWGQVW